MNQEKQKVRVLRGKKKKKKWGPLLATSIVLLRAIGVAVGVGGGPVQIGEGANAAGSTGWGLRRFLVPWRHWFWFSAIFEREWERLKERELIRFFVRSFAWAWRVSDSLFIHAHCEARRPMNELWLQKYSTIIINVVFYG